MDAGIVVISVAVVGMMSIIGVVCNDSKKSH